MCVCVYVGVCVYIYIWLLLLNQVSVSQEKLAIHWEQEISTSFITFPKQEFSKDDHRGKYRKG